MKEEWKVFIRSVEGREDEVIKALTDLGAENHDTSSVSELKRQICLTKKKTTKWTTEISNSAKERHYGSKGFNSRTIAAD